jgi:hypothetical protein
VVARVSAPVQIGPASHQACCTVGTGSLPGVKRPGNGVDHSTPSSAGLQSKQIRRCNKCKYEAILWLDIITSRIEQLYGNLPWEDNGPVTCIHTIFAQSKQGKCCIVQVLLRRSGRIHNLCLQNANGMHFNPLSEVVTCVLQVL